jgi:hypothetical protein
LIEAHVVFQGRHETPQRIIGATREIAKNPCDRHNPCVVRIGGAVTAHSQGLCQGSIRHLVHYRNLLKKSARITSIVR